MNGFEFFPQLHDALYWLKSHEDLLLVYICNAVVSVVILLFGRLLARLLARASEKVLERRGVDITIVQFFAALVRYAIMVFAIIAALGRLGIETSSIITVLGAAGLAVGLALQGSLANFAAGFMLVTLRPFRVGEMVQTGCITGVVEKVHIFSTTILTADRKEVVIPNGKVIADPVINFSRHPWRRIDLTIGVGYANRICDVKSVIHTVIMDDRRIDPSRGITVRLAELAASSLNFTVRVWVRNADYFDVMFDLLEQIKEALDENNIDIPFPKMDVHLTNIAAIPEAAPGHAHNFPGYGPGRIA